jgi:hypothetical protein
MGQEVGQNYFETPASHFLSQSLSLETLNLALSGWKNF